MGAVKWKAKADRVAWHSPYILLFDPRFIEIRHAETGRLAQIIPGNNLRCIWDGSGANQSQPIHEGSSDEVFFQHPRVHGVMNPGAPIGVATERVFELVPTGPLPLLGSFVSRPTTPPWFYPSDSPAHSDF